MQPERFQPRFVDGVKRSRWVRARHWLYLPALSGRDFDGRECIANDVAAQTEQAMQNALQLLEEAGSGVEHLCKLNTYFTDRAWRIPAYQVLTRYLGKVPLPGTSVIIKGFEDSDLKVAFEFEVALPAKGAKHQRLRRFNLRDWFDQPIDRELCMVVKTEDRVFLRGQTGSALDASRMVASGHSSEAAAEQTGQAINNANLLLEEAGASLADVDRLRVYVGDRAYLERVTQVLGQRFQGHRLDITALIVGGFTRPEILVEIDMIATLSAKEPLTPIHIGAQTASDDSRGRATSLARAQTERVMEKIARLLACRGASLDDICKLTLFSVDRLYIEPALAAIGGALAGIAPVVTILLVNGLDSPGALVAVEVEALKPGRAGKPDAEDV